MNVKYVVAADFETSGFYHQKDHFNSNITKSFEWRIEQLNRRALLPSGERGGWSVNTTLNPLARDRGYRWEVHIDQAPIDFWTIQGMKPRRCAPRRSLHSPLSKAARTTACEDR